MAKARRGRGSKASQQPVPKKRAASPDTSDTDPELIDSSEPRWEPLKIRDHYFGTERQMTASQQLMGSIEDDFAEDTVRVYHGRGSNNASVVCPKLKAAPGTPRACVDYSYNS